MTEFTNTTDTENITARPSYTSASTKTGVIVTVDLPGVAKLGVTITSEKQQLKIQALRSDSTAEGWNLVNNSSRPTHYKLVLNIHPDLDLNKTSARVENGVLNLQIRRRDESLPRQIEIDQ
ncbi:MAG: Hsp20/alpha crystallin family protein [Rubritalea sp.]|uniref:Hsp20/alpha crystallin family protein n=1 Tax=Rubritalea sp. TaxID=2109375 RepID=UPI003242EF4A